MTLKRISDARASQYWDKEHLVSKSIGEEDGVVWDYVAVYPQGKLGTTRTELFTRAGDSWNRRHERSNSEVVAREVEVDEG